MNSIAQLELPIANAVSVPVMQRTHIDFPLKPLPVTTANELKRLSTRWGRGQTLRSLKLHGLR